MRLFRQRLIVCSLVLVSFFTNNDPIFAQNTTFYTGSAIIDMGGAGAPTVANSLKPYGLIYALLSNYNVPVNGIISQTKVKDGIDFTYGAKGYKGGTYIISSEYITPDVKTLLNSWASQGVIIDYLSSSLTVNVTYKISFAPKWAMDKTNGSIAVAYLTAAGIPATAYSFKTPDLLGSCDDIFVLPHASPTWNIHNKLYFFNKENRGAIFVSCIAVSALESLYKDTVISGTPTRLKMNFLTSTGLVPGSTHKGAVTPFVHQYPTDPMAQYIGTTDAAQLSGAEVVYMPIKGGVWNSDVKIITKSPTQINIPTLSDGPAAVNVYGRGFGDANNGYVFYEAAHNVGGTAAANVAAQRMFLNFSFFALGDKAKNSFTVSLGNTVPAQIRGTISTTGLTATVTGTGSFTYEWKASVPGTFSAPTSAVTNFTPADVSSTTQTVITCIVKDIACSRTAFDSKGTAVVPSVPMLETKVLSYAIASNCDNNTFTFNLFDSVPDANAGTRTLSVGSATNGIRTFDVNTGTISYTPTQNFQGTETLNYTISNGVSSPATSTITFNIGNSNLAPILRNDSSMSVLEDSVTVINVFANDKNNPSATSYGAKMYIREIASKPKKGYAYINSNGTISYLSFKNAATSDYRDTLSYTACNNDLYCSTAFVYVKVIDAAASAGYYKRGISTSNTASTVTLNSVGDAYLNGSASTTKYGADTVMLLQANKNSSSRKNMLLKFDLSTIPSGLTINSATLKLYINSSSNLSSRSPLDASIYPLKINWDESTVSYDTYSGSSTWSSGGARSSSKDYQNVTSDTLPSPGNSTYPRGTLIQSDITRFVDAWQKNTYTNYGLVIFPKYSTSTSSGAILYLASKENANSAYRPTLVVNYGDAGVTYPSVAIPSNYKPIAYADNVSTPSNANLSITPLSNDFNYYSNTNSVFSYTNPAHGTVSKSGNTITYTPDGTFVGYDTLTYTVKDATNSQTTTATIRINVTRVAPKINSDTASTKSATAKSISVTTNDADPQGSIDVPVITVAPLFGTAVVSGNNIIYTPNVGYVGKDSLIYTRYGIGASSCNVALSDTAIVRITVTNQAPAAVGETLSAVSCRSLKMNLVSNDSDPEGTPLTIYIQTQPSHGTLSRNSEGGYDYTSNTNYVGADSYTYKVKDGSSDSLSSNIVTVSLTVAAAGVNNAPIAVDDNDNTILNQEVLTDVLVNDSDPDNDSLSMSITGVTAPSNGAIEIQANNTIKYTPALNYAGTDSYQYKITDNSKTCSGTSSLSTIGTVTIVVKPLPILISGTVWNDKNNTAANTFTSLNTTGLIGTNAFNTLNAHLVNSGNIVIDNVPVGYDGTYLFSNAPSQTSNLKTIIHKQLLDTGATLSIGLISSGFINTTPLNTPSFNTTTIDTSNIDFGVNQLPTATSYIYNTQTNPTNPTPTSLTIDPLKFSGTDKDGSIASIHFTNFPNNVASITINSTTYTSTSWPINGVTVGTASMTVSIIPEAGSITPIIKYKLIDNANFESVIFDSVAIPLYVPLSAGIISLDNAAAKDSLNYCGPSTPSQIYVRTAAVGGRSTIKYQWEYSITSSASGFAEIIGANTADYTPSIVVSDTTYYRRKVFTTSDDPLYSNVVIAYINPLPTILDTTGGYRSGSGTILIGATPSAGATINWYSGSSGGTILSGGTGTLSFTTPSIIVSTIYYAEAQNSTTGCLSTIRSAVIAEVVGTINPGSVSGDQSQCGPGIPSEIVSDIDPMISTPDALTYQWQSTTSTDTSTFTNIVSATATTYAPTSLSTTTYFRRKTMSTGKTSVYSNIIKITINPVPTVPTGVNKARTGVGIVDLLATTPTGIAVDWYDASVEGNLLITGNNNFTTPILTDTTYYYAEARNIITGCISAIRAEVVAVLNENFNPGVIAGAANICIGATPALLTSSENATGGTRDLTGATVGTYSYQWESSTTSTSAGFSIISGAISTTFQPGAITTTTFYRRKVSTTNDGFIYSNVFIVNVNALPVVTTISNSTICNGSTITLTTSGASTYSWSPSTGLSATNIASPIASPTSNKTYTVTGTDINGCSNTATVTISVNAIPSAPVGVDGSRTGTGTVDINATVSVGETVDWYAAVLGGSVLTTGSGTLSFTTPSISSTTTYYAEARNTTTSCTSALRTAVVATIIPSQIITVTGTLSNFTTCAGTSSIAQSFVVAGSNLTNDIVVSAPAGYELSLASGGTYAVSLSLTQSSGTVSSTTIYVRLKSNASNGASGNISTASTGATTQNISTGTAVVNGLPTAPIGVDGSRTGTGTVGISATVNVGETIDWYAAVLGGSVLTTGSGTLSFTTPSISTTTNYYAEARNTTTGCISSTRTTVKATIIAASGTPAPTNLSYPPVNILTKKVTNTSILPTVTGTVSKYTISPNLPAGLVIDSTTGEIKGTPTIATDTILYTITASNSTGSISATTKIKVDVILPQASILLMDKNLLSTDTAALKFIFTNGTAPYTVVVSNNATTKKDTIINATNDIKYPVGIFSKHTIFKLEQIIDAQSESRINNFTKDTALLQILEPLILLTLKADAAVKQPDNSFKTKLLLKIKNAGALSLNNVQVNANLSNVFPSDINYKLDSVRVTKGNLKINPTYKGDGTSKSVSSVPLNYTFVASNAIKTSSSTILDANYLFDNGVTLAIGEEGDVVYYLSIAPTTNNVTLKLQFASAGSGVLTKSDGAISNKGALSVSDDGTFIDKHPDATLKGTPAPTYLPLIPVENIGASLNVSAATRVAAGYVFHFIAKIKNYGNTNIDSLVIKHNFANSFITADSGFLINTPIVQGNITLHNLFNGYTEPNLVNFDGRLVVGDSASVEYDVLVKTNKEKNTWLTYLSLAARSSLNNNLIVDTSTNGLDPDPNKDGSTIEKELTRFSINFTRPLPPTVMNVLYTLGQSIIPSNVGGLVKSTPSGSIPVWCDITTAQCTSVPPTYTTLIGKYIYQLRSYDTLSLLYSENFVNDTVIIRPPVPIVKDSTYVIGVKTNPLNIASQVTGMSGSTINYYSKGVKQIVIPILPTIPGISNFAVSQTVNNIESDSAIFKVTMLSMEDVIHLQKLVDTPILQPNSTFNITFTFIASNLTKYAMDNVVITDNLQNSVPITSEYSILSSKSSGGLNVNNTYNGNSDINLSTTSSKLAAFAKDTVKFIMNIIPKGFSGQLSNVADIKANSQYGTVNTKSSSLTKAQESTKLATYYTIPPLPINIPEGFSPNHDGVNDRFVIIKPYGTVIDLSIFNRWGVVVYSNSNYNNEWDGKGTNNFLGQDLLDGGYYYSIKAKDIKGATQIFKGFVIIQR